MSPRGGRFPPGGMGMKALILSTALVAAAIAAPAAAQDYDLSVYTGWQTSPHSRIEGDYPGTGASFDELIGWEGKSFEMPPYYGLRGTWWRSDTFGVALEFTHAKVYANEDDRNDAGFDTLEFTDGINILTLNAMQRWPGLWGSATPYAGAGLGVSMWPYVIPPSVTMIVCGIATETSIGRLFLAGVLPGLLLTVLFMISIAIVTKINPKLGPPGKKSTMAQRGQSLVQAGPMLLIVLITIGGIYGGVFTPTEAAAVGAMLAFLLALFRRRVNQKSMSRVLLQTIRTTCLAFFILIGAHIFNPFMALTDIPSDLASLLLDANLPRTAIMLIIMLAYIVLGTFLEGFAMLVLTLPIIHPLIVELGYDPIWFGVVIVIVIEMGLISPPVGVNVFVVKGIAEDVPLREIFGGIIPFWIAMAVCLVILLAFPEIALFLPDTMIQSFD
mgnify:CR=1 FL=1